MLVVVDNWRRGLHEGDSEAKPSASALPEAFKEQMTSQITRVLQLQHPVYKVMCKISGFDKIPSVDVFLLFANFFLFSLNTMAVSRALGFLRSTLSAEPPNPIPLPTGFGALSESTTTVGAPSQASVSLDPSVCALEKPPLLRPRGDPAFGDLSAASTATANSSGNASAAVTGGDSAASTPTDLSRIYDLALIASRLMPLVVHNRHVFGPRYAEIIHELLKPSPAAAAAATAEARAPPT